MTTIMPPSPTSSTKKPSNPGHPWSHLETIALIDAYESKWYSLNRGQLKAHQWEEVSAAVSARCATATPPLAHDPPPKTGTQCRHKIEKLRKRYRAEKARPVPSLWPYFDRMDRMESGPAPISVKSPAATAAAYSEDSGDELGDDNDDGGGEYSDNVDGGGERVLMEVAREVRRLGEGLVRVEKRRMELMREVESDWMRTEAKRAAMMVEAQKRMLDGIVGALAAIKKARKDQAS